MEFSWALIFDNQIYLLLLALVMLLSFFAKKYDVLVPLYEFIVKHVKSKRLVVVLVSFLSGVLPISGRVAVSAGVLDTLAPYGTTEENKKKREPFGIIDYLSTHLFYFWSPLEKTVLVPMAVLGLSYLAFLEIIWPLLATGVVVVLIYIFGYLKEDDIEIDIERRNRSMTKEEQRAQIKQYVKTISWVAGAIVLGNVLNQYSDELAAWIENISNNGYAIVLVTFAGLIASFLLGSSGKFAGFTAISTAVFGVVYLPLFFAFDYMGYMASPAHKCMILGKEYFGTPFKKYYAAIGILTGSIAAVAILLVLFQVA